MTEKNDTIKQSFWGEWLEAWRKYIIDPKTVTVMAGALIFAITNAYIWANTFYAEATATIKRAKDLEERLVKLEARVGDAQATILQLLGETQNIRVINPYVSLAANKKNIYFTINGYTYEMSGAPGDLRLFRGEVSFDCMVWNAGKPGSGFASPSNTKCR